MWQPYDDMGDSYLEHAARSAYNALYDRPAVLRVAGDVAGLEVLDAGCGPGLYAEELAGRGAVLTAIDASEEQLRLARARVGDRAAIRHAVLGEPLPFADDSFDLVVCALVIHYVADRAAVFSEFCRVLRAGGRAIVSTQHPTTDWLRKGGSYFEIREEEDVWTTTRGPHRVRFWREPLTTLCHAATSRGFVIKRIVEPLPEPEMQDQWPDEWGQLTTTPGFLVLELLKPHAGKCRSRAD